MHTYFIIIINSRLKLNAITGEITITGEGGDAFDREVRSKHYLTVEARDDLGTGNRNTVQLIINIEDVNDNPPIFVQNKYETRLIENKVVFETPLIVEARDLDLIGTNNSAINYNIVDGEFKENFTLNPKSGKLTLNSPIDFEMLPGGNSNVRPIFLTVSIRSM